MEQYDLAVIGACASGMAAAIQAARLHPAWRILLLEKLPRPGKKLLATGNGRCNLTNLHAEPAAYHNSAFAAPVLTQLPPQAVLSFFASLGLRTYADAAGRVYPRSNTAASVLDALRFGVETAGITLRCDSPVTQLQKNGDGYLINARVAARRVLLATGGKAAPAQGSDGSGYALAKALGHTVTPLLPALTPLVTAENTAALKGVRAHDVTLTLTGGGQRETTAGEVLFTAHGLSGIAAMELAAAAGMVLNSGKGNTFTAIDFLPEFTEAALLEHLKELKNIKADQPQEQLLTGLLPKAIGQYLCKAIKLYSPNERICQLPGDALPQLAAKIKRCSLRLTETGGFAQAQVTRGGVAVDEVEPATLQSKRAPGLYFAGELLDVDGPCGGYNLQWAFASGLAAAAAMQ